MSNATIVLPPPLDDSKFPIENALELTPLHYHGPDIFTNTRPLWHPPGARGVYGGAVIAQCLSAAILTLPSPSPSASQTSQASSITQDAPFFPHSLHAYFVLPGTPSVPIIYHVERVRDGRNFYTRTVQARQGGRSILTASCSFVREGSGGVRSLDHGITMPAEARGELEKRLREEGNGEEKVEGEGEMAEKNGVQSKGPFRFERFGIREVDQQSVCERTPRQWFKACGPKTSPAPGVPPATHFAGLAYISDSWFIGTVARVYGLFGEGVATSSSTPSFVQKQQRDSSSCDDSAARITAATPAPQLGMMLSLDHTIYFHSPLATRIDEWMYSEMSSPWSGSGRGLVTQRIWNADGVLLATCFQEGVVRLKRDTNMDTPPSKL